MISLRLTCIFQMEEVQSELESAKSLSKEQKDDINSLTADLEALRSEKNEIETQLTVAQNRSAEADNQLKDSEAEKVSLNAWADMFELINAESLALGCIISSSFKEIKSLYSHSCVGVANRKNIFKVQ